MILLLEPSIKAKLTKRSPILFGEPQYDKAVLFSYSIYDKATISEVRFSERKVLKHFFDENNRLIKVDVYSDLNRLVSSTRFKLLNYDNGDIVFEDWTNGGKTPNIGRFSYSEQDDFWTLAFSRRYSFLGYFIRGEVRLDNNGFIEEELYRTYDSTTKSFIIQDAFSNQYELFNNEIEKAAINILENGWSND